MAITPVNNRKQILTAMMNDPIIFAKVLWPDVNFYSKQIEVIKSITENFITVVPAANMMGKDFVSGFIALWFFLTNWEVRVVTTSVKDDHLRVLWGEIGRFIDTARKDTPLGPLKAKEGGPLVTNFRDIKKLRSNGTECKISYLRGMVSEKGEGMAGHHAQATLGLCDESSGISNETIEQMQTWAKRILLIGNPLPCSNLFYKWVKEGDLVYEEK